MKESSSFHRFLDNTNLFLAARICGHLFLIAFCLLVPAVGPERFTLAAVIAFVFVPLALIVSRYSGSAIYNPADNYLDMICACIGAYLTPGNWHLVVLIAIVLTQAPVLTTSEKSLQRFLIAYGLLLVGFSISGIVRDIEDWEITMGLVAVLAPGVIWMSLYQARLANEYRSRAMAHDSIKLVAGGVAHDFNNILTSVLVNAELALKTSAEDRRNHGPLIKVIEAAKRASLLSSQLLSLSGKGVEQRELVDVNDEIRSVSSLVQTIYPAGCDIELSLNDQPVFVLGDRSRLQQIFINVIINAAEVASRVFVSVETDGEQVITRVRDNGAGIDPKIAERIFEPFFSAKKEGRGMGLAVVNSIAAEHGGDVSFSSTPGEGTEFTITFPISHETKTAEEPEEPEETMRDLVIIADDEPNILSLMKTIVSDLGYRVVTASDGQKFCERFDESSQEVLMAILDLKMPEKSGWECLDHIRSSNRTLPVLIVSGFDPEGEINSKDDAHVTFLSKPFTISELTDRIKSFGFERTTT